MAKDKSTMLQAYAAFMAAISTALADALHAGVPAESLVAAMAELTRILEEE